jgi:hypothetical protein
LEDDKDVMTETLEASLRLQWWEEEEEEMLEEQEALLVSFDTERNEERTRAAAAQDVRAESSMRGHGRISACPQLPVGRIAEVARIWKAAAERRKAFEGDASCSANGEGAAAVVIISSDEEE